MSIVRIAFVLGALGALPWMSQAQTVAGRSPGSFSASESGAATYAIPIRVPPGIAGIEPSLAITYNSQGGNGLLGVGWSLSGLSAVTRCPMTYAQDGVRGGVNFDWNDRFCLDGQRLVAISGTYGADGTEYRTERESFTRVISYSSPAYVGWFKAWTKAGQTMEYTAFVDNATATSRMLWGLSRVQDTVGNYLNVSYVADTANHVHYPSRIDYTGNARNGQAPANSVRFEYEGRLDAPTLYQAGTGMREPMRLSRVRTYVGEMLVREYRLAYDNAGAVGRSRLVSVTECEAAGSCLPPISLQWSSSNGDGAFTTPVYSYPTGWDFGADPSYWQRITGDFNGDGKTDFARVGPTYAHVFISNGDGTFSNPVYSFPSGWDFGANPVYWQMITGDFNGDGRTDFARVGPTYAHVFLSNGDGSFSTPIFGFPDGWNFGADPNYWQMITGDWNGDGKTDFARVGPTYAHIFLSNGDGSFSTPIFGFPGGWNFGADPNFWQMITGDFDGDGKTEFARLGPTYAHVFLSAGTIGDLATSISDGLGAVYSIAYKPLTDASVYSKDAGASYPVVDVQAAMYAVSSSTLTVPDGTNQVTNYAYGGLKAEQGTGRGSVGFRWMESAQQATGVKSRTEFRQDWPYVGMPSLVKTMQGSGGMLSQVSNALSCTNPATGAACTVAVGNRYFPFVSQSVQSGNDLNAATLPTVTTTTQYGDNFGNATSVVVSTGDGYSKSTTNVYSNDTTNWLLGRLKSSTVQSTTP